MDSIIPAQTHNEFLAVYLKEALSINKDPLVEEKLKKCLEMVEGLEEYLENTSPPESALQKSIFADTMNEPWTEDFKNGLMSYNAELQMISSRHSSQFLKTIAELSRAERILEIGMFTGYTASVFCESAFSKEVTTLEFEPYLAEFVKSRITGTVAEKKLEIIVGKALDSLETLKNNGRKFDLVFIDADKINYINYYKFIMDNGLVGPNGIILMDNTLWKGELFRTPLTPRGQTFTDLNAFIQNDPRVTQVIVQVCDGISMVKVKP